MSRSRRDVYHARASSVMSRNLIVGLYTAVTLLQSLQRNIKILFCFLHSVWHSSSSCARVSISIDTKCHIAKEPVHSDDFNGRIWIKQHVLKKAKLFHFMATQKRTSASQLNVAYVGQQLSYSSHTDIFQAVDLWFLTRIVFAVTDLWPENCAGGLRYHVFG